MISAFIVLIVTTLLAQVMIKAYQDRFRHSTATFTWVYVFHLLLFLVYYTYAAFNSSDSRQYYRSITGATDDLNWIDYYGVGTSFIEFMAFPFVEYLGLSYEAMMLLFSFFGFVGFIYFYLVIIEHTTYRHKLFGVDFIALMLFLPNMHFWTVSLGKGSVMFLGLGLFFYGLSRVGSRLLPLLIGGLIVYHVRSHIMLVIVAGTLMASLFSSKGIKTWQKIGLMAIGTAVFIPIMTTFLTYAGLEEADAKSLGDWQEHRSSELGKATSGVNLNSYSQPMRIFTFLFRPLFVDAPNAMGLVVSIENLFYLTLFIRCLSPGFVRFIATSPWLIKIALISFIGVSIALAQVTANTGIAIRQKAQVMYLFFLVFITYADYTYSTKRKLVIGE